MNRCLKFRVWDEKYRCWDNSRLEFFPQQDILKQGRILTQFTGLKDTNDIEIWEGDIVKYTLYLSRSPQIGKVIFLNGSFHREFVTTYFWSKSETVVTEPLFVSQGHLVVIGNVFENFELLNLPK